MVEVIAEFSPGTERREITLFVNNPRPYRAILADLPIMMMARRHGIRVTIRIITKDNTEIKEDHIHYPLTSTPP
jgi:hypothetical protein